MATGHGQRQFIAGHWASRTEDRGQRTEDRGQRTEDRGQRKCLFEREKITYDKIQRGLVRGSEGPEHSEECAIWLREEANKGFRGGVRRHTTAKESVGVERVSYNRSREIVREPYSREGECEEILRQR